MARKVLMLACALLAALTHASVDPRGAVRDLHGNARQWAAPARHIAGLHYPIDITPRVDIPDEHWLTLMFPTLLGRMGQSLEYRVAKDIMRVQQHPVHDIFYDFMNLPEFQNNPALSDPAAYVTRVYQYWLRRMPTEAEIASWTLRLTPPNVQTPTVAQPYTWFGFQQSIAGSSEYATNENICPTGYYSLNAPVNPTSLLMADLFNGTARLQLLEESELLRLTIPSAQRIWDQKMPIVRNPDCWLTPSDSCPKYVAFTRTYRGNNNFYLTTLRSYDAVNFAETEEMWHSNATYYDGHISVDHSVCPPRYVMTMECSVNGSQASLCTAYTTTPSMPWSWSEPKVIVYGCRPGQPGQMSCNSSMVGSASTGVTLIDGHKKYMAWTNVVDGDPKIVKTYSAMTGPLADVSAYFGTIEAGTKPIRTMLDAQPGGFCTSSWDCNCKDKQDWKREGDYYYALFNGANYYRCGGTWGISIARDTEADAGVYTDELPLLQGIPSVVHNTCGISYPVLNVIDGELFVYYAGITKNREPVAMRSRIVPIHPSV